MKIREILLEGKHAPEMAVIYIIRDGDEVLYVGRSWGVEYRICQHFGHVGAMYGTPWSDWAVQNIPASYEWDVEFIELPEDLRSGEKWWMLQKEAELIKELKPRHNSEL